MSKKMKRIISVLTGVMVALWLVGPSVSYGMTAAELQAQIDALLAQLQELQTQLAALQGGTPTPTISGCTITSFDRNLKLGMTGDDVNCLQIVLNSDTATQLASSGAGSPGNETSYFGPLTKGAVIKFQEKYADDVLAPWGLTAGTGFVGSTTRTKLNEILTPVTPPSAELSVSSHTPATDATEVALDSNITAVFNMDLDSSTVTTDSVKVTTDSTAVAGTVGYDSATKTITFDPTDDFAESTTYTVTLTTDIKATDGTALASEVSWSFSTGAQVVVPAVLTVALADDTPAASSVVAGQSTAPLTKFVFTNDTNEPVKVTNLKLQRLGISEDSTLTNVYLFEGAKRLTDSAAVSSSVITFNDSSGIFTVPANSSITVTVSSDIATGTSGQTLGVGITSADDITADATITGTFPLNGNLMTSATATLAGVEFASSTTPSANTSLDPQDNFTVWQNSVSISSRAVDLTRISFRNIGSINADDLQNFRFYVDGTQVGSAVDTLDDNGYVTFDFADSPKRLNTGTRVFKLMADIVGGSNRTFRFSIRNAADITSVDSEYGVNVLATIASSGSFPVQAGQQTVSTGTITITKKTTSPSGEIVNDASSATLALFEIKAAGEAVKIETLDVSFEFKNEVGSAQTNGAASTHANSLDNGQLYADGVQIGSTKDISENSDTTTSSTTYTQYSLGSSLIVYPGSPVELAVKADVTDGDGTDNIDADDTIQIIIEADTSNAIGQVSGETLDVPSSDVSANELTVSTGGLTLAKYTAYTNQTFVVPQTAAKLAHFTLNASTTEDVNVNDITIDFTNVSGTFDGSSHISNAYITYGSVTGVTKSTVADSDNSWSISYDMSAGDTIDVVVYGNISSSATGSFTVDMQATGVTSSSGSTVYGTGSASTDRLTGQTITIGSGTFEAATDGSSPLAQVVAGDQTITAVAYKFTAQSDTYKIKKINVRIGSATASAAVLNAILKDGDTVLATRKFDTTGSVANDTASFTGLDVEVPMNTSKVLTVDLELSTPSAAYSTTGQDLKLTLYDVKYEDSTGSITTDTTPGAGNTNPAGNDIYVFKSVPTLTADNSGLGASFVNGTQTSLYQFKVTADSAGSIAFKQIKFSVAWSDVNTQDLEIESLKLFRGSTDLTDNVTIRDEDGTSVESTTGVTESDSRIIVSWDSGNEESIGAGSTVTYTLKGTPQDFNSVSGSKDSVSLALIGGDDSVDVRNYLTNENIYELAATQGATTGTARDFIWSDNSATIHSASNTTSSNDWHSGYLIENLNLGSKGWSL